ncbi:MAG TPA: response regulator [Longimicrobiales bacterium]|nr:response regulator [Longimicrobiales bacterium]
MNGKLATIFVADDDPTLLKGLNRALSGRGYNVRTAPNGPALLSLLETARPDLLVLDIMMPGMSGLEVLRRVKGDARWSELPVMMVTALTDAEVTAAAWERGASDVIPKPFRLNDLVSRIEARLNSGGRAQRPVESRPTDGGRDE